MNKSAALLPARINEYDPDKLPDDKPAAVRRIVGAMLRADLDPVAEDDLKAAIVEKKLTTKRPLNETIKRLRALLEGRRRQKQEQQRDTGSKLPQVEAPSADGPLTAHVAQADEILAG